jgi:coenzyme Q-binding protein COQ10
MPRFSTMRRVHHAASDMFDLVADVEKYPQFLPLCKAMRVRSRREQEDGTVVMVAEMTVAYKLIHQTFTSRVTLDQRKLSILVEYLDGPFKRMQNRWAFEAIGEDDSEVDFFIDYEFKSRAFSMLMGAMFDTAFRRFSTAFEQRADQVYGRKRG